jgi:hypothetical protein
MRGNLASSPGTPAAGGLVAAQAGVTSAARPVPPVTRTSGVTVGAAKAAPRAAGALA